MDNNNKRLIISVTDIDLTDQTKPTSYTRNVLYITGASVLKFNSHVRCEVYMPVSSPASWTPDPLLREGLTHNSKITEINGLVPS